MTLSATKNPEHWRKRAKEARAIAEQLEDQHSKAEMLAIAQDYENLAERAEQRANESPRQLEQP